MTSQQEGDVLLAQWQTLRAIPPADRVRVIRAAEATRSYDRMLDQVREEMVSD